jgi:hypothetical protein
MNIPQSKVDPAVRGALLQAVRQSLDDPALAVGLANTILFGQSALLASIAIEQARESSRKAVGK